MFQELIVLPIEESNITNGFIIFPSVTVGKNQHTAIFLFFGVSALSVKTYNSEVPK